MQEKYFFSFSKCNSQLHRQPSVALLLVIKHVNVPGMLSMSYTVFSVSHSKPKSNLWNGVQMMQNPHDIIVQSLSTQRSSINNSHSKLPFLYSVQIVQYFVKVKYWIWIIYTKKTKLHPIWSESTSPLLSRHFKPEPYQHPKHLPPKKTKKKELKFRQTKKGSL